MAEEVRVSECRPYIEIISSGSMNSIDVKEAIERAVNIYEESGIDKVLVNSKSRNGMPTTGEVLNVGKFLAVATEGKIKFAVLVNDTASLNHITKLAADIHGGSISYFQDLEEARSWLNI